MNTLIELLSLDTKDRNKRDIQSIELQLHNVPYFDQLSESTGKKLYQNIIRGFAKNGNMLKYSRGSLIWRIGDKQEKLMILLGGRCIVLKQKEQQEINAMRVQLIKQFPNMEDMLQDRPGRNATISYDKDYQLVGNINDNQRLRRNIELDLPKLDEQSPTKRAISKIINQNKGRREIQLVPPKYLKYLLEEINQCLQNVIMQNHFHLSALLQGLICRMKPHIIKEVGDLINGDLNSKKQDTLLFALQDCFILSLNLVEYQELLMSVNLARIQKQKQLLEIAFGSHMIQDEVDMIVKLLIDKIIEIDYCPTSQVYSSGQKMTHLYIVRKGEFQIQQEARQHHTRTQSDFTNTARNTHRSMQEILLAQVGTGSLLGEESYSKLVYSYKCVCVSAVGKVIAIKLTDINVLTQRYAFFKEYFIQRQQIKQQWLDRRIEQSISVELLNTDRQHKFEQKLLRDQRNQRETQIINRFQKLKPKLELNVHETDNLLQRKEEFLNSRRILENQVTKLNKTASRRQLMQQDQTSNERNPIKSQSLEQRRNALMKRITQHSEYQNIPQVRNTTTTSNDVSIIPILLTLDKSQQKLLKHVLLRSKLKQPALRENKPTALQQFIESHLQATPEPTLPVAIKSLFHTQDNFQIASNRQSQSQIPARLRLGRRVQSQMSIDSIHRTSRIGTNDNSFRLTNGINQFKID